MIAKSVFQIGVIYEEDIVKNLNESRRRFMSYFAGIGLASTLAPGILWARMQDAGAQKINLAMVNDALKMAGVDLPQADRDAMVIAANASLTRYEELHKLHIPNDVSPPFHFSSIVPGIEVNKVKEPFRLSTAPVVSGRESGGRGVLAGP